MIIIIYVFILIIFSCNIQLQVCDFMAICFHYVYKMPVISNAGTDFYMAGVNFLQMGQHARTLTYIADFRMLLVSLIKKKLHSFKALVSNW